MSNPTLSRSEHALLQYLHDHTAGSGERTSLDPKCVIRALRIGKPGFDADVATLSELGFAGARRYRTEGERIEVRDRSAVWITGKGEDFLRLQKLERSRARAVGVVAAH